MVKHFQPEWFLLITGAVFIAAGIWLRNIWLRETQKNDSNIEPISLDTIQNHFGLSKSEMEVLIMLIEGKSNVEMADQRHVSVNTIKTHVSKIYQKIGVNSRVKLLKLVQDNSSLQGMKS